MGWFGYSSLRSLRLVIGGYWMIYKIYTVHGTFAADPSVLGNRWWQKQSPFSQDVLSYLDTQMHRIRWEPIQWSGANNAVDRGEAANQLAEVMGSINQAQVCPVFLCHSHGGNVFHRAENIYQRNDRKPAVEPILFDQYRCAVSYGKPGPASLDYQHTGQACLAGFVHCRFTLCARRNLISALTVIAVISLVSLLFLASI